MSFDDDLIGRKFHRLTVISYLGYGGLWHCRCECGNELTVRRYNLLSGNTKACGCKHFHDLAGQKFGKLTVIRRAPNCGRRTCWYCDCDCGTKAKSIWAEKLVAGNTVSCGCHRTKAIGDRRRTHGATLTREYRIWHNMKRRCQDPDNPAYPRYGGRGILVAHEFQIFEGFIAYMGQCPDGLSLERKNNNGNYEPGNVCWTDRIAQGRNKRNNRLISFHGKKQSLSAWAEELGITDLSLMGRIGTGWPLDQALTKPKGYRLPKSLKQYHATRERARVIMKIAIAGGRLVPQPCEICGATKTQGHHTDYSKPLAVRWLCRKHHALEHRNSPKLGTLYTPYPL